MSTVDVIKAEIARLVEIEKAARDLRKMYICNDGKDDEFISCITPGPRDKQSPVWQAWDRLRKALGTHVTKYP